MGLQRLGSNGSVPNLGALGHRGALVALGAVGLSLGAAWAWKSTKDHRLLQVAQAAGNEENCLLPPPQKSAGRRRKRHKARPGVEPVPEELAEATGNLCCKASADGTERALSDTASTDEPIAEAELDVSDDTSFAAAAQQAVGNGAPIIAVLAEAPVVVQAEDGAALTTPPDADDEDDEDWSVVERRRPRRQREATPEPDAPEAGCNTGEGAATPAGQGPEEEAAAGVSAAADVEMPEEEAAAAAAASAADDVEMLDAIFTQHLPEELQVSGVTAEATVEPEAELPPLPDTPAAVGADGQKKKKSKKKKRSKEEEPVSDDSRACSPRAADLPQGLPPPPPLHPGHEAPPAEADSITGFTAQEAAAFAHMERADSQSAAAKGLPPPLPHPATAPAQEEEEADFTAEEAIAAVARMEREGGNAVGADDGWATVTRRKPRRNGEERPSGDSVGSPIS